MKLYYDFHIHSALSACADDDMTPGNIVNMARLKGLDVIAVTDHNSVRNAGAAVRAGERVGLHVLPGMEVQTAEDVHVLCLFPALEAAEEVAVYIYKNLPDIKNRADIFCRQLLFDDEDNVVGEEERMLANSAGVSMDRLFDAVLGVGGVCVPAHIDRPSYSVISNLGFFPPDLPTGYVEISGNPDDAFGNMYENYGILRNSDAHSLGAISERTSCLDIVNDSSINIMKKILRKL